MSQFVYKPREGGWGGTATKRDLAAISAIVDAERAKREGGDS